MRNAKLIKVVRMKDQSCYITSNLDQAVSSALTELVKDPTLQYSVERAYEEYFQNALQVDC